MLENTRRKVGGKKKKKVRTRQKTEAPTMSVRPTLKQPEKKTQKNPGEKGWACHYRREGYLKQDCPQASKPPLAPSSLKKDHTGKETALRGIGPRGQTLKKIGAEGVQGPPLKLPS